MDVKLSFLPSMIDVGTLTEIAQLKADVSRREGDTDLDLLASIVTDLLAQGSTTSTKRI